jgi:transcription elongation factor GreA
VCAPPRPPFRCLSGHPKRAFPPSGNLPGILQVLFLAKQIPHAYNTAQCFGNAGHLRSNWACFFYGVNNLEIINAESKDEVVLTEAGRKKLNEELEDLKNVKRREVAERLKNAISYGDLMENSEYDDAKNEQARVEHRIDQIETMLARAKVIDRRHVKTKEVGIGSLVEIKQVGSGKKQEYRIVGPAEANPENHMVSFQSPVGSALMGLKIGDIALVSAPAGKIKYRVTNIKK